MLTANNQLIKSRLAGKAGHVHVNGKAVKMALLKLEVKVGLCATVSTYIALIRNVLNCCKIKG